MIEKDVNPKDYGLGQKEKRSILPLPHNRNYLTAIKLMEIAIDILREAPTAKPPPQPPYFDQKA